MNPLANLHAAGQSIWLDSISRALLDSGTIQKYIDTCSVTGLTSNPTIFDQAIEGSSDYDDCIRELCARGLTGEDLFFELAMDDIQRAADLFRPTYDASDGADGFVSLEVSPTLADDAKGTVAQARDLYRRVDRPNVMIKVPGTSAGCTAIEELVHAGIPINVTLLFDANQYRKAGEAYQRGLERRVADGLPPLVASVASVFISRWDTRTAELVPAALQNQIGIAVGARTHSAYRALLATPRWQQLAAAGARPQRLLWASTGVKNPDLDPTLYVHQLAADQTVNTMPEATLLAFRDRGSVGALLGAEAPEAERLLAQASSHCDPAALAMALQEQGKTSFVASWDSLLACLDHKSRTLTV